MATTDFPKNLMRIRNRKGCSVLECATAAGVSIPSWYRYESGEQFPGTAETFDKIAAAVGVKSATLLKDT